MQTVGYLGWETEFVHALRIHLNVVIPVATLLMHPSFSERWKVSYLYAVEKSAAAAVKLNPDLHRSVCGISQLH